MMQKFILSIGMSLLIFGQAANAQQSCAADDLVCVANLAIDAAGKNSDQAILGVITIGAVGYGIYKLSTADSKTEEAQMIAKEYFEGLGIRLNNPDSHLRISTLKSIPYRDSNKNSVELYNLDSIRNKANLLSIDYRF